MLGLDASPEDGIAERMKGVVGCLKLKLTSLPVVPGPQLFIVKVVFFFVAFAIAFEILDARFSGCNNQQD